MAETDISQSLIWEASKGTRIEMRQIWESLYVIAMKFTVERYWIDADHCHRKSKPNYGMRDHGYVLEELSANQLELTGLLIDGCTRPGRNI